MKFLCDVHISYKIRNYLNGQGFVALHVNDLPGGSETTDGEISRFADSNDFILITKDADFVDSYLLQHSPSKLMKINLGNIANDHLLLLIKNVLPLMESITARKNFLIEINANGTYTINETQ